MNIPLVSIIIPTFNSAATLHLCLNSILDQTFKNLEVIIVDGCSKDETSKIVEEFKRQDPRIQWYSEHDNGIYHAMNKGIKKARGNWILFLGSDDTLYSIATLGELYELLDGFDVVYGNVLSTRFNGIYDGEFTREKIVEKNICHQAILFKKEVFKKVGSFNLKYRSHADWDHNLKWFLSDKIKKKYVQIIISNYADGGFSSTNDDVFFDIKYWKYSLLTKDKINFLDKLRIIRSEFKKAIDQKRRKDALMILLQVPYFLL